MTSDKSLFYYFKKEFWRHMKYLPLTMLVGAAAGLILSISNLAVPGYNLPFAAFFVGSFMFGWFSTSIWEKLFSSRAWLKVSSFWRKK